VYKKLPLNFLFPYQYHSAQHRTAEEQHRQLCICIASCMRINVKSTKLSCDCFQVGLLWHTSFTQTITCSTQRVS